MRICIDPGHSGPVEPGACADGFIEAALTLSIAFQLGSKFAAKGHDVIYTRAGDIDSDGLSFRADMANAVKADVFLSIHCNAAENPDAHGVETFHYPGSSDGQRLAESIQSVLAAAAYTRDRGVKSADFAVLRLSDMPAVLIECGFITSAADRAVLTTHVGQERIAASIVSGIKTCFD